MDADGGSKVDADSQAAMGCQADPHGRFLKFQQFERLVVSLAVFQTPNFSPINSAAVGRGCAKTQISRSWRESESIN